LEAKGDWVRGTALDTGEAGSSIGFSEAGGRTTLPMVMRGEEKEGEGGGARGGGGPGGVALEKKKREEETRKEDGERKGFMKKDE